MVRTIWDRLRKSLKTPAAGYALDAMQIFFLLLIAVSQLIILLEETPKTATPEPTSVSIVGDATETESPPCPCKKKCCSK